MNFRILNYSLICTIVNFFQIYYVTIILHNDKYKTNLVLNHMKTFTVIINFKLETLYKTTLTGSF